tara:strand:+ start:435 stop:899 length:465 start_codon:yes stop_codon:yes gene_type:complete
MPKLTINENPGGFTDELVITFDDFSVANAGTLADRATKTFTYAIPAGSLVTKVSAKLVTAFNDSGSGDDLTITVGDGDAANGFLTAADIHTDASEITYVANTGSLLDNENGKVYTTADTIDILFSPDTDNDAPYSLNELTAGEIKLKFEICDLN